MRCCNDSFLFTRFQYQFHAKIDNLIDTTLNGMTTGLIAKLMSVLEGTLSKLSRYDEGSLIGSIMSLAVSVSEMLIDLKIGLKFKIFLLERVRLWKRSRPRLCQLFPQ